MTNKPIDLVIANTMHEAAKSLDVIDELAKELLNTNNSPDHHKLIAAGRSAFREQIARKLLCSISHDCTLDVVFSALAHLGAPSSSDMIQDGLQAVQDTKPNDKSIRAREAQAIYRPGTGYRVRETKREVPPVRTAPEPSGQLDSRTPDSSGKRRHKRTGKSRRDV